MSERSRPRRPARFAAALACGSALAAPMLVEFLRILPLSLRGYRSYSPESALLQSWDPRSAVEWLVPLCFGPPDFSFHGQRFYDGLPPLFYSFAPGLLCFLLVPLASSRRSRSALWGWILVAAGIFLALGKWNPAVRALYEIEAVGVLRYPVKVWLWVALGAAMLCGVGFERLLNGGGRRLAGGLLATLATLLLAASTWLLLSGPNAQTARWAEICLRSVAVATLLAMALYLAGRRPALGGALLLGVHLAGQVVSLAPLFDSDAVEPYVKRPVLLSAIPEDARLVHGGFKNLFGPQRVSADAFPDPRTHWLTRSHFEQLYPYAGISWGRRYELDPSPEGLDSFFTFSLTQILPRMRDVERVRVLAASGVGVLLLDRPLDDPGSGVRLLARAPITDGQLHVYEITPRAAPVQVVHRIRPTPHLNAALAVMTSPSFDPTAEVALPGEGAPRDLGSGREAGRAEIVRETWDEIEIEVDATTRGVVVVQRTFHKIYRATLDGEPVPIEPANLHRLGIEVPPGRHRLRIRADRGPTRWAWGVAVVGVLGLVGLSGAGRSKRR